MALLLAPAMRRPLAMGMGIMVFQQLSGINAVIFYSVEILQTAGMDNADLGGLLINAAQVVFTGVSILLMDRAGRRVLTAVSSLGMALALVALAVFYINDKQPSWSVRPPVRLLARGCCHRRRSPATLTPPSPRRPPP